MPSSTSSSETTAFAPGRTWLTFLLAGIFLATLATNRPPSRDRGLSYDAFYATKLLRGPEVDAVILGDSRVFEGVAPEEFAATSGFPRVLNFGFGFCALDEEYLDAGAQRLAPGAGARALVIGVTPLSLTSRARQESHFRAWARRSPLELRLLVALDPVLHALRPMGTRDLKVALGLKRRREEDRGTRNSRPDGWSATALLPEDPDKVFPWYRTLLEGNPIDQDLVEGLTRKVAAWTERGHRVLVFRPPVRREVQEFERSLTGFDLEGLVARLEAAGGIRLEVPGEFHSYDGTHLREDAAREFSRRLGEAARAALDGG